MNYAWKHLKIQKRLLFIPIYQIRLSLTCTYTWVSGNFYRCCEQCSRVAIEYLPSSSP